MIKSLKLKNWKSHENTELEFTKGTTVLIGQMGSGKTSVMDAISFALFGTFPSLNSRKLKLEQCIMDKPEKKEQSSIQLIFTLEDNAYEITRIIERGKGTISAEFRKNGKIVETGNTKSVTESIEKELQIDYELFSRAVYSEQNQIDYFLQIPSGQRKKKIDELLKLDRFEKARTTTTSVINRLKNMTKDKEQTITDLEGEDYDKKITEQKKELEQTLKNAENLEKDLQSKKIQLDRITKETQALEEKQEKARTLENQLNSFKGQTSTLKEKTNTIKDKLKTLLDKDLTQKKQELEQRLEQIKNQLKELKNNENQKKLEKLNAEKGSLEAKLEELTRKSKEKATLEKTLKELEKQDWKQKLGEQKEQLKQLEEEIGRSQLLVDTEEKRLKQLDSLQERCPVCDAELTEEKRKELTDASLKTVLENKKKIHQLKEQLERTNIEETETKLRQQENTRGKLAELDTKSLEETKQKLETTKNELETTKNEQKQDNKKKEELEKEKEKNNKTLAKIERITELQTEYKQAQQQQNQTEEQIKKTEIQLKTIDFKEKELKVKREMKEDLKVIHSQLKTKIDSSQQLIKEKQQNIETLEKTEQKLKQWKQELIKLKETIVSMDIFKNALEATQIQLREETLLALNAGTEDLWPKIYPYKDYTSLKLAIEGSDYALQVKRRDGTWVNVEGIASGGERSTACLALRIAFSLVLTQNISWLVLDEPTHNLDTQGVATLANALREHLPELVEQVFIITHEEEMETAVSGTLYRFERKKELDEPTNAILVTMGPN